MSRIGWSDLPEELIGLIADRSSNIDFLRIRSICKPWRSAAALKKRFPHRFQRQLPPGTRFGLFPTTFFRLTQASSCPNKVWLIKTRQFSESSKINLLCPLSGNLITTSDQTLDLLKLGVSEIRQSYNCFRNDQVRAVLLDNMFFIVHKKIWYWNNQEENSSWWRGIDKEDEEFSDIIVYKGNIYALDLKGVIWWISLSKLNMIQYRPSIPMDMDYDYENGNYKDRRLVEYSGDLCIVHRFYKILLCGIVRTVDFKVYKMDETLAEWVEVSSLGDKAMIMATDSCFTVSASEYGCLGNAIYFTDGDIVKLFKLDDRSFQMIDSSSQSCFQMFSPLPFL